MMRYRTVLLLVAPIMLGGCTINTTIPLGESMSQQQKQSMSNKQQQEQNQSQTNSQTASTAADQTSSHASESKQGTNSMPVIIVCNNTNSPNASCATPREGGGLETAVDSNLKRKSK